MRTFVKKGALAGAATLIVFTGAMATTTAYAGGPGSQYVDGPTYTICEQRLNAAIVRARKADADVSGVYNCFKSGAKWYGGFVANY